MNNESTNLIYKAINKLRTNWTDDDKKNANTITKEIAALLETALANQDTYNGWTNYETWLMNLVLSNEYNLNNEITDMLKTELLEYNTDDHPFSALTSDEQLTIIYDMSDNLKDYVENNYTMDGHESIIHVDCEYWTYRDFQEINWISIVLAFLEYQLRAMGFKGKY